MRNQKKKKAQVTIEFLIAFGIFFLLMIFMIFYYAEKRIEMNEIEDYTKQKNDCLLFATAITSANTFYDGTQKNITFLEQRNITIYGATGIIYFNDVTCTIPVSQVYSTTSSSNNTFELKNAEKINLMKKGNKVVIELVEK